MLDSLFRRYDRIIFFDTETTGFEPDKGDQVIELAAVAVDRDGKMEEMDEFINLFQLDELPDTVIQLTGITDITLALEGHGEEEVIRKFIRMMQPDTGGHTLLAAYNAQFDLLFTVYAILRHWKREGNLGWMGVFNGCDYLDAMTVYKDRRRYPHKLEDAIREYGLAGKVENSHRAVDDCRALFEVVKRMEEENGDLDRYVNLFGYNPKYGPSGRTFKKICYKPQGFDRFRKKPLYEED